MLTKELYDNYLLILKSELVQALGCTEPIAIAYCAAKAREVLGAMPKSMEVWCSGNIIKNVKGVTVPNTGGLKGIEAAAIAGIVGGNPDKGLQVLEDFNGKDNSEMIRLLNSNYCSAHHLKDVENLYISTKAISDDNFAEVHIKGSHTNIVKMIKNGEIIFECDEGISNDKPFIGDKSLLNIREIFEFAETVRLEDIREVISSQILMNSAISEEGIKNNYGACVGKTLLKYFGDDIKTRAKAKAAAGSDARMSGCSLPVVINSGSGNQGITVSLPVIEYAKELNVTEDKLYRALVISNLTSIHQKHLIGKLSAYCGAVSAAAGSGAAITYLYGGDYEDISRTIINTIANVGGMLCDGAKPSCAAKIASAVDAAIMGHQLSSSGNVFKNGEGLVKDSIETTIESFGRVGKIGMEGTDIEIINIMLNN